jgi:methylated-DNA-[protein]-cysteine S-methyltransferase
VRSESARDVYKVVATPIGDLRLVASDRGLKEIHWGGRAGVRGSSDAVREDRNHPALLEAERQLTEYFAGRRRAFTLELDFHGTAFQKRVWAELLKIPYGETRSYRDVAVRLGDANATRAVGAANGRNPIPIVAPCHRVIGASGDLTGFGGGLDVKRRLLDFERGALTFDFASGEGLAAAVE